MQQIPLVSIIIPAYHAEKYIKRSLDSALNQTYKNIEILVIDDGSKDKTADIIKSYQDTRIRYLYQENQGQGAARNNGIGKSKGEYITFLDADDIYLPEKVEKQIRFLEQNPEFKIVYCNALHYYSDKPDKFLKKKYKCPSGDIFQYLLHSSLANPNTVMLHAEVFKKGFMFREERYFPEEWELYLKMSCAGFKFGYIDEDLVVVEIRDDSNTSWDIQHIVKKYAVEMFEDLFSKMDKVGREYFQHEKVLKNCKFKLAIAYLVNKQKREFFKIAIEIYPRLLAYLLYGIAFIIPSDILKSFFINLWKWRQKKSFYEVNANQLT